MREITNGFKQNDFVIAANIGEAHIIAAIIDLDKREVIGCTRTRLKLPSPATSIEILEILLRALKQADEKFGLPVDRITVVAPNPYEYESEICLIKDLPKYEAIYGLNSKRYLSKAMNIKTENILFRDDTAAFLHGEVTAGIGMGYKTIIGITLGSGLGIAKNTSGVTMNIDLMRSKFNDRIADARLSTRFLLNRYFELSGERVRDVKALGKIAEKGDKIAAQVFRVFTYNLCFFLKDLIDAEHPDAIVIGGHIRGVSRLFFKALTYEMNGYFEDVEIMVSQSGEDSALIGAAAYFHVTQANNVSSECHSQINFLEPVTPGAKPAGMDCIAIFLFVSFLLLIWA